LREARDQGDCRADEAENREYAVRRRGVHQHRVSHDRPGLG